MDTLFISHFTNFRVDSPSSVSFDYEMPDDGVLGKTEVWEGLTIPTDQNSPLYTQNLPDEKGRITLQPATANFINGSYTITISAADEASGSGYHTIAATHSIQDGSDEDNQESSLRVIDQSFDSINTRFKTPSNISAAAQLTWVIIREGEVLGQGATVAEGTSAPGTNDGLIRVSFNAGNLQVSKMYNIALNPGSSTQMISAGEVFTYNPS